MAGLVRPSWVNAIDAAIRSGLHRAGPAPAGDVMRVNASQSLGGRRELVLGIAERLLPALRANTERRWADRTQTVLAGQSLGGVTR